MSKFKKLVESKTYSAMSNKLTLTSNNGLGVTVDIIKDNFGSLIVYNDKYETDLEIEMNDKAIETITSYLSSRRRAPLTFFKNDKYKCDVLKKPGGELSIFVYKYDSIMKDMMLMGTAKGNVFDASDELSYWS